MYTEGVLSLLGVISTVLNTWHTVMRALCLRGKA